jgi:serine/threonine protein phosphatase PrpC
MPDILFGFDTNPGGRKYNEDRCGADTFVTRAGLKLSAAVVCDGVGGEERGERAAQLAVDTVLAFLRDSDETDLPRLLTHALKAANVAAYMEAVRLQTGERMACTMVLGVIVNDAILYIANAGDSRIYLCRDGELQQLTRDHTFENVMVWLGKLSPEAAASNPDANKVMRVLGIKDTLQVDLGIYLTTTDYGEANRIGREGFPLKPGDSILLCSDGLIKNTRTTGQPLVTSKEIVHVLQSSEGMPAARAVMSIALGRIPVGEAVDNITVALLQTADPARAVNQRKIQEQQRRHQQRRLGLVALAVGVPLCALLALALTALGGGVVFFQQTLAGTATQLAQATAIALAKTETVAAYTPTPTIPPTPTNTPTPVPSAVPTLAPGEIAKLYNGATFLDVLFDDKQLIAVPAGQTRFIAVNHRGLGANGNLYLSGGAQLQLDVVIDPKMQFLLFAGSDVFVQSGPYQNGAEIELAGAPVVTSVRGCLAAHYLDESTLVADCFKGNCAFSTNFGAQFDEFAEGQQITLDAARLNVTQQQKIPQADALKYWNLLRETSAGRDDIQRCNVPPPPTPTPTRAPTASPTLPPTATVVSDPGDSAPTNAPPTAAPPTSTPLPTSTATPIPPSDTPVPPTDTETAAPPTDTETPLPPTDTPTPLPDTPSPTPT